MTFDKGLQSFQACWVSSLSWLGVGKSHLCLAANSLRDKNPWFFRMRRLYMHCHRQLSRGKKRRHVGHRRKLVRYFLFPPLFSHLRE
jgi:hypothetical protein